jgi:20S proteasome alpha/beta subunit
VVVKAVQQGKVDVEGVIYWIFYLQSRPFGVALLFAGFDEKGPQLYHMDPSGTYVQYEAKAIGSGSEGAQQTLVEMYNKVRANVCVLIVS